MERIALRNQYISERFVDFEPRILWYLLREICAKIPASCSTKQNCLGAVETFFIDTFIHRTITAQILRFLVERYFFDDFKKRYIGSVQKHIDAGPADEEQTKGEAEKPPIRRFSRIDWPSLLCLFGFGGSFLLPCRELSPFPLNRERKAF